MIPRKQIHILFIHMLALTAALLFCIYGSTPAFAKIADEDALYDSIWNYLFEDNLTNNGVIQSICSTPDYLITIENTSDDPSQPDTVSSYYKNPFDKNGNPVEQYSLVMRNSDIDWEHGNGMAYNPNTDEIYVALYSNDSGDNEGTIYVMDPSTLTFKRKIKIADGYNILGIDYDPDHDVYYTLTDSSAGYTLQQRGADFNLLDDLGPIDPSPGTNFQDICVSGDYIFLSPLTYGMGIGDFMNIYSISRRETLLSINMDMGLEAPFVEAEGVCMAHTGVFVCPVTVTYDDGSRHVYFFETTLPWFYKIETSARATTYDGKHLFCSIDDGSGEIRLTNMDGSAHEADSPDERIGGTVSGGSMQVLGGTSYTVEFRPDPGYKVTGIYLDRSKLDIKITDDMTSYTLDNINGDHRITVDFAPIGKTTPTPTASPADASTAGTGSIDESGTSSIADENESDISASSPLSENGDDYSGAKLSRSMKRQVKAILVILVFLIMLLTGLAIFYMLHVRRVRVRRQKHWDDLREHDLHISNKELKDDGKYAALTPRTQHSKKPRKSRANRDLAGPRPRQDHGRNTGAGKSGADMTGRAPRPDYGRDARDGRAGADPAGRSPGSKPVHDRDTGAGKSGDNLMGRTPSSKPVHGRNTGAGKSGDNLTGRTPGSKPVHDRDTGAGKSGDNLTGRTPSSKPDYGKDARDGRNSDGLTTYTPVVTTQEDSRSHHNNPQYGVSKRAKKKKPGSGSEYEANRNETGTGHNNRDTEHSTAKNSQSMAKQNKGNAGSRNQSGKKHGSSNAADRNQSGTKPGGNAANRNQSGAKHGSSNAADRNQSGTKSGGNAADRNQPGKKHGGTNAGNRNQTGSKHGGTNAGSRSHAGNQRGGTNAAGHAHACTKSNAAHTGHTEDKSQHRSSEYGVSKRAKKKKSGS